MAAQRSESVSSPRRRHSPSLDLESGQQDLLLSDGFLPLQHDGDSLPVHRSLRSHAQRRPRVVQAAVGVRPEHPGDLPDPGQPAEDEPGGSAELLLAVEQRCVQVCPLSGAFGCLGSALRSATGVYEGSALKQTLRGPAGCPPPQSECSLCAGSQPSTTLPIMHL
ncbi:hypothetical protein PFLUV_G00127740 [Perca fluviatilis]|uniref:Uncharacterized protein n=1 Tax=Perca fluviatilis TaxID=8168 RepID=A0A6A5F4I4_PERFL|nr:hypothetical protein PFLUV_G00127740 [Perca fluviatilis]